jgi:hypothetical protein
LATNTERAEVEIARNLGDTDLDALIAAARQQIDSNGHGQLMLFRIGDAVATAMSTPQCSTRGISGSGSEPSPLEGSSTGWPRR